MAERVLSGRYRLVERLGAGGMGVVWRAEDLVLHREVAVKTVAGPGVTDEAAARLEREARAAAGLTDNPHVVTVHDFGRDGDTLFIVMALAAGQPLDRVLSVDGVPSPARAADWAGQVCAALEAAHSLGVVHRDIKPANAVLGPDGTVRVLDFGIAWFHPDLGLDRLSRTGGVIGSAPWMSPEQARGEEVGPASDLYALGCLLYQLLTGEPPFGGREALSQIVAHAMEVPERPSVRRPGLPAALDDLVVELLAKDPRDRPASAAVTAARLGAIARELGERETAGRPTPPPVPPATLTAPEPDRRPVRRRTVLFGVFGVVAVSSTAAVFVPQVLDGGGDPGGNSKGGTDGTSGTGTLEYRWKKTTPMEPFAAAGPVVLTRDGDDHFVAYDTKTGGERWRGPDNTGDEYSKSSSAVYVTVDDVALHCLDPATGKRRWEFAPLGAHDTTAGVSLVVAPEAVYVGIGSHVYAVDHATGHERWHYQLDNSVANVDDLWQVGGLLLARVESSDTSFVMISTFTGLPHWPRPWTAPDTIASFIGAVGDRLFFAVDGTTVVSATSGTVIQTYKNIRVSKVVPEHEVLISDLDTSVSAWSAVDGSALWTVVDARIPSVVQDTVLMNKLIGGGTTAATVGINLLSGAEVWRQSGSWLFSTLDPDQPVLLGVGAGTGMARVDPKTGALGPVRRLPDKELDYAQAYGDTVYARCFDLPYDSNHPDADRGGPRLYAVDLAKFA
ncbi:protein kinase [Streptomyces cocklensis]|uniref:non-specific serine/threonine protein kinase n=1 Tax=Actinacidiphila cocklensis TaxID=887465 RepID=A0A9W4DMT4_9ACTN|nr:protein kinase [Actinacidiphila cocklensis]MDD1057991.1 protein kinase [Actinacidiphila cocklensis]CAG6393007.1 putative Non-specific serine/threonine protein kinase [Actinacidiphila cocklensis]